MKRLAAWFVLCTLFIAALPARGERTREEVRARYAALGNVGELMLFAEEPSTKAPYAAGALTEDALQDAIGYANFLRWLAGLDGLTLNEEWTEACQRCAVLLASLSYISHTPEQPQDMEYAFYEMAAQTAASSNLAGFNWLRSDMLRTALNYFARDDGERNLDTLGHRRWLLNPYMGRTSFGLAGGEGFTSAVMYAHDFTKEAVWDNVCWPSNGAFPAELMRADLAWSVTLNPEIYDLSDSAPAVTIGEERSGASYVFAYPAGKLEDGCFSLNDEAYGAGPCLIFRPDLTAAGIEEYEQNQVWSVRVTGLKRWDGTDAEISYTCRMISLSPIDAVSIELENARISMQIGETRALNANVIPAYADDTSVTWVTSDPAIAAVDASGTVTALSEGICTVSAAIASGRADKCEITVTGRE